MLYPTHIKIENNVIKTINLSSTRNKNTSILIIADDEYDIFNVSCVGDFTLAERAQLKALMDYLF